MNERNEGGFGFIVGCGFMFFVFGSCISTAWLGYSMGKGYSDPEIATENQKLKREDHNLSKKPKRLLKNQFKIHLILQKKITDKIYLH